jgi:hypothetical protein
MWNSSRCNSSLRKEKYIDLNECAEKPEEGDPDHCKPEGSILSQPVQPSQNLMHRVESHGVYSRRTGEPRDADGRTRRGRQWRS